MQIFKRNSIGTGLLAGFASTILSALLIYIALEILNIAWQGSLRYFLLSVIPCVLLIRYYARKYEYYATVKGLTLVLITVVVPVIIYLVKTGEIFFESFLR